MEFSFGQNQGLNQAQRQQLRMSEFQMQALKILQKTNFELLQDMHAMLETNFTVEMVSPGGEYLAGNPLEDVLARDNEPDYGGDGISGEWDSDAEARRQHFFDSLESRTSPQDDIKSQIRDLTRKSPELTQAALVILGNLDSNGWLAATDDELAASENIGRDTLERARQLVMHLSPAGLGARSLEECLRAQLETAGKRHSLAWKAAGHLEDVAENRLPALAKKLNVALADLSEAVAELKKLNPRPGAQLADDTANFMIPEAYVFHVRNVGWQIQMNKDALPVLAVSDSYREMAKNSATPPEARRLLQKNIAEFDNFMRQLNSRQSTLERITRYIVQHQVDFLENGVSKLKPLTQQDVARELGLDDSTVSRAIADKCLVTPWGKFRYSFFFSSGYTSKNDGEELAGTAVRQRIREMVDAEDKHHPLSDQKLSEMLMKEGLDVARRTVAKYREQENIPATSQRRQF